jgi:hypothetical protein
MKAYGNPGWGRDTRNLQDIAYATKEQYDEQSDKKIRRKVEIDGVVYRSIMEASRATGISQSNISMCLKKHRNMKNHTIKAV